MTGRLLRVWTLTMLLLLASLALPGCSPNNEAAAPQGAQPSPSGAGIVAGAGRSDPVEVKFSELYAGSSSRGLRFSDKLTGLEGQTVVMTGYMAPPLKPSFTFFVLAKEPMAICPFCSSDASWPEDIVLIYLPGTGQAVAGDTVLRVTGRLELGSYTDPDTGFVSQIRIHADKIEPVR